MFDLNEDILQIGGPLYFRFAYSFQEDNGIEDNRFSMPTRSTSISTGARPTASAATSAGG